MPPPRTGRRSAQLMLSLSSVALLSACGGGGEDAIDLSAYLPNFMAPDPYAASVLSAGFDAANTVTQDALTALLSNPEYQRTRVDVPFMQLYDQNISTQPFALRASGAAFAHAALLTGNGQTIAISDERMSPTHDSLGGRVTVVGLNPSGTEEHGTSVASVAAGNDPGNFIGTAPGANILFGSWDDASLEALARRALQDRAVAWNNSWGYVDTASNETIFASNTIFQDYFVSSQSGAAYFNALKDYAAYGVVVFAVSNDETDRNSGIMDALPLFDNDLESGWLAVVNGVPSLSGRDVTAVNLISSPCWEAARWCIAADGSWNAAIGPGSDYEFVTGSSFAAPQVAGALALLAEAFPGLANDPHALRVRLLASADDTFAGFNADATVELATGFNKPYSVIYGHGFLDIEAALKPIGGTAMITSLGETVATNAPVLMTGSGFGDAVELSLADTNVAVRDALSAGFVMPGVALTAGARPGSQAGALLAKALRSDLAAARTAIPAALSDPFDAFNGPVLSLSAADGTGSAAVLMPQGDGALGFTLTRVLTDGPTKVEVGLKLARDNGGLLSLDGEDGAAMASVALGVTQDLGNGAFMALSGEMGLTDLGGDTALGNTSSARFDAVKLTAGQSDIFTKGDRLSVGVGMPIAIASGETVLDLPVSRAGLAAGFEGVALDLAPENRQLDMELTYQTALADGVEMQLSIIHSDNFGNRAGETDTAGALAFAFRF